VSDQIGSLTLLMVVFLADRFWSASYLRWGEFAQCHDSSAHIATEDCFIEVVEFQQSNRDWVWADLWVNPGQLWIIS
jgi:hypothetical protein